MLNVSLRTKFLYESVGLVVLLGLAIIVFIFSTLSEKLTISLQKRGVFIAQHTAHGSVNYILTEDLAGLKMYLIDMKKADDDIEYLFVLDKNTNILTHTFGETFPVDLRKINIPDVGQEYRIQPLLTERGGILDIAVPILSGSIGVFHLGISEKSVKKGVAEIIGLIMKIIVAILIIGGGLAIIFATAISRPISELTNVACAVARGDLNQRVKVRTKDEIGKLASSFNKMTEDLKLGREEIEKHRQHLEELVEERTAKVKIVNEQLQQEITKHKQTEEALSQKVQEIEAVNQELNSFTYTVSHDLKEPLRGIETFSRFLLDDCWTQLDDTGKDYLKRISRAANRMKLFIDDLLALSRVSRIKNPYQTFEPEEIIKDVLKRLDMAIKEKDCKIKVDDSLPLLYGDKTKLKEVFYNLISNAIKYNNKKPEIEIGVKESGVVSLESRVGGQESRGEDQELGVKEVIIYIKDNGIGMREEDFERVFKPFKRLHKRDEYEGGTGIGLAIVKKVIEEHRGKIWVESKLNEGSTFYFSLSLPKN